MKINERFLKSLSSPLLGVFFLVTAVFFIFLPAHPADARVPEPSPTPEPTLEPECIADWCGPVCEFPTGVNYTPKPTTPDWLQDHYNNTDITLYDFSTPPRDSLYICIDEYIGIIPIPNPNEMLALRNMFLLLRDTAKEACENQEYCNVDGDMSKCKFTYEMVDPDRPTPPDIYWSSSRGEYYAHGCMRFYCKKGDVAPKGCDDDNEATCDICNEDGSCSHPPAPDCGVSPSPSPTPPPSHSPSPTPTDGGGRTGF